jgi:8-oxo-dGTP diphosphatase
MIRRSISFVIRHSESPGLVLAVRRPPDDDDLPDAWGLPAGSLRDDETWQDAVRRAGRDKLGVELEVGDVLQEGTLERSGYTLHMRLYEARIVAGQPAAPQKIEGVTQYTALDWLPRERFVPAAEAGSLCCRLYLRTTERDAV